MNSLQIILPVSRRNTQSFASLLLFVLCGCQRAPTVNIAGSFFPVWIMCVVVGIAFAAIARVLFIRLELDKEIRPSILIYPCIVASFALTLWLIFFR
jgi:YtcA family